MRIVDWSRVSVCAHVLGVATLVMVAGCGGADSGDTTASGGPEPQPEASPSEAGADQAAEDQNAPIDAMQEADVQETGPTCMPKTCAQLGANCGEAPDGCGGKIECGTCQSGQICGGGGGSNKCGVNPCYPKTCAQVGATCGLATDGCALVIDCGFCPAPLTCGGGGKEGQCGCAPKTCAQIGASCGTAPDGCGGVVDCGSCASGQTCGGGGTNQCGTQGCTPKSCAQLGASCGVVSDACSKAVDCGSCTLPDVCGGQGMPNQCGCTPKTCAQLSASCGLVPGGCGSDVDCGSCGAGDTCGGGGVDHQCGCVCQLPHATTTCVKAGCSVKSCDIGFADCDGDPSNGCEADLASDGKHCGQCGNSCDDGNGCTVGDSCQAGTCVPGTLITCDSPPNAQCYAAAGTCEAATGQCVYVPAVSGTACNADSNACTSDTCDGKGTCAVGAAKVCNTPPNAQCYNATGTCAPATGVCSYTPKANGTACGTCHECTSGVCGNSPNGTACGANVCHYCSAGACAVRATGYQYDGTESHRCCGGSPVDISSNESHCGGCGLACASGHTCQSVSATTSCTYHPATTSGRCGCNANSECPKGTNGLNQTCRTYTPYTNICTPDTAAYCASGETYRDISSCPNYCYYP
ncbi:MAG: hypothetical protein HY898_15110 [Deltaproteobacteria bacterium]|nr:hypothetical protein [Deltaproteobacteria bacterium]